MNQNQIFASGEGDAWFKRNLAHLKTIEQSEKAEDVRYICEALSPFSESIDHVLEIGCSNGIKLEAICRKFKAKGVGLDPSIAAVESGNQRAKSGDISLLVGTGDNLPFQNNHFDLIYFSFCLYIFDRNSLLKAISEADRVLKPGGFIVITDFDPGNKYKRLYSHADGVFSYKQDYSQLYTSSGLYYIAGKYCFSHRCKNFDETGDERVSTTILYKETDPYPTFR